MASDDPKPTPSPEENKPRPRPFAPAGWAIALLLALAVLMFAQGVGSRVEEVSYSFFRQQVLAGNVESVDVDGERVDGEFRDPPPRPKAKSDTAKPDSVEESETDEAAQGESAGDGPSEETSADETSPDSAKASEADDGGKTASDDANETADEVAADTQEPEAAEPSAEKDSGTDPARMPERFYVFVQGGIDPELRAELDDNDVTVKFLNPPDWGWLLGLLPIILMVVLLVVMFSVFRRSRDQMMGGGMLGSVGRSTAKRYEPDAGPKITFDDVAGLKGVKRDLKEIVDFLREPERFQRLGARVPKGVLLNGPPGTGKTLLAKAVAGEAGAPFFSINGSEFIQMFVGVGASRVRDMFKTAKKAAPSILFIDEIDAIGRQRGAGLGGGHDEREQTLNQILSEMDGFTPSETVIVIAATNRPDVLDPALLRPGRFDRHITVDRPSLEGREQLFEVHTRKIPLGDDVDLERLARATSGLTGADIANLVNEAALWATRHDKRFVTMDDFEFARDKAYMGAARDDVLRGHERKVCAYHEAGHALVAWLLPDCDRVHKVTIIPRGRALGVTQMLPDEDRHNMSQSEIHAQLAMALGGRAAEKIAFDEYSVGASSDLERSTQLARRMVTHWGMSERVGPVALHSGGDDPFLGREIVQEQKQHSEHTAQVIDDEVSKILHAAADRSTRLLEDNRGKLDAIAEALLDQEEIGEAELTELVGPSAQTEKTSQSPPIEIAPPEPAASSSPARERS